MAEAGSDLPQRSTIAGAGGVPIAVEIHSGDPHGRGLVLVHATGFCKGVWAPVVSELRSAGVLGRIVAIDLRGHGDSGAVDHPIRWPDLGKDVAAVMSKMSGHWVGLGHSSGGAALAMAEARAPGMFDGLVMVEPIIFPGPRKRVDDRPIALTTLRRRRAFPSRAAALANLATKDAFADCDERALRAYVACGFRDLPDGTVELKCSPETEADFFREGTNHDTWDLVRNIACPVFVVAGARSTTHPVVIVDALVARLPDASSTIVEGSGHLLPMERPALLASLVRSFLDDLEPR